MRYLYWFFVLLIALVAADFAVSNRDAITLALWPLLYTLTAPLYLVLIGLLAGGFVIGRVMGYIASVPVRRERNRLRVRLRQLESATSSPQVVPESAAIRRIA